MSKNHIYLLVLFLSLPLFSSSIFLSAQMPDWKFFRDREGNGYYYDKANKIRITDENPFLYTPVSIRGIDYFLYKGIELIKDGKYTEGLYYLKSIKTLPMENLRVENNAKDASKWINHLQKKHGVRYERFDKDCTILLNFFDDKYSIINEKLRYKIILKKKPRIVKALWKFYDQGYGLKFGFNLENEIADKNNSGNSSTGKSEKENFEEALLENKNSDKGYDCIVGIESRILKGKIGNVAEAAESWRYEFGKDNFKREEVLRKDDRVIYIYTYSDGVPFTGIEAIFINGRIIHILRVLCSSTIRDKVFEEILKPVEEMVLVR